MKPEQRTPMALPDPEFGLLDASAWLTPKQAGRYLGMNAGALCQRRYTGNSPPYVKVGRLIRYRKGDLDAWLLGTVLDAWLPRAGRGSVGVARRT